VQHRTTKHFATTVPEDIAAPLTFRAAAPTTREGFSGMRSFAQTVPTVVEIQRPYLNRNVHELDCHSLLCVCEIVVSTFARVVVFWIRIPYRCETQKITAGGPNVWWA